MVNKGKIACIALIIALIALASQSVTTVGFTIIENNTNLAPDSPGHPPGTGERISGNLYYNNDSAIEIFLFSHASSAGQTAGINLTINGTSVSNVSVRPIGAGEETHTSITAIIPRYSNYSAHFENFHHYEWREYPIISGDTDSTVINYFNFTNITGGNATGDVNTSQLNLKVNKSGDNMTGDLNLSGNNITGLNIIGLYDQNTENTIQFFDSEFPKIVVNSTNMTLNTTLKIQKDGLNAIVGLNNTRAPFSVAMRQNFLGSISFITNWNTDTDARINSSYPVWIFRIRQDGDDFQVVRSPDGVTFNIFMSIDRFGKMNLQSLAGVGDRPVCAHTNGTLFAC